MYKILSFFSGYLSFLVAKLLVLLEKQFVFFGKYPIERNVRDVPSCIYLVANGARRLFRSLFHTQNTTYRIHSSYIIA